MSRCDVSEQIAKHCSNDNETFCPECGENMYVKGDGGSIVECSASECDHEIDMEPGEE